MAFLAPTMKGSASSFDAIRLARALSTAVHDHLTHPGVSFVAGGITPRRTNSSTVLSEMLSSQANSLRLMKDGGRLATRFMCPTRGDREFCPRIIFMLYEIGLASFKKRITALAIFAMQRGTDAPGYRSLFPAF